MLDDFFTNKQDCQCTVCKRKFSYGDKWSPMFNNDIWDFLIYKYGLKKHEWDSRKKFDKYYDMWIKGDNGITNDDLNDPSMHTYICYKCAEKALGRKITKDDLIGKNVPLNSKFERFYFKTNESSCNFFDTPRFVACKELGLLYESNGYGIANFDIYNPLLFPESINEGLIKSYDINYVLNSIAQRYDLETDSNKFLVANGYDSCNGTAQIRKIDGVEFIVLEIFRNRYVFSEELDKVLSLCGYHVSSKATSALKDVYVIDRKFDKDLSDYILKTNDCFYHITNTFNVPDILEQGLCPRHKSVLFNYPDRVYLFGEKEYNNSGLKDRGNELFKGSKWFEFRYRDYTQVYFDAVNKGKIDPREYSILKIDKEALKNMKIYKDGKYPNIDSFYVVENIHPKYITEIDRFKV